MAATARRKSWLLPTTVFVVAVGGVLAVWGACYILGPSAGDGKFETPAPLTTIPTPLRPGSLAWSADGNYLAGGTWGLSTGETDSGEVYVIDIANASIVATLKATTWVECLAFSPDGKWLAVGTRPPAPAGAASAALIIFDVPAFTAKHTANVNSEKNGFIDISWTADSKSIHAIEGPVDNAQGTSAIRHWDAPTFAERQGANAPKVNRPVAISVSPDGRDLAIAEESAAANAQLIRVIDLASGADRTSFRAGLQSRTLRLGFTADGKAVGVFDTEKLSWWDSGAGKSVQPGGARFAVQPAGLSHPRSYDVMSPDGRWKAQGHERHRGLGDLGWDNRDKEYGAFIQLTQSATGATRNWRVGDSSEAPAVAFSPDGTKLAGTVKQGILIWAVPK